MCGIGVLAGGGGMVRKEDGGRVRGDAQAARRGPDACETVMVTEGGRRGARHYVYALLAQCSRRGEAARRTASRRCEWECHAWNGEA